MAREKKFDWQAHFTHAGEQVYIQGSQLQTAGERVVGGALRGARPDYGTAEVNLIGAALRLVKINGETKWKRGERGDDVPSKWDSERRETTADRYLKIIITLHEPHLAEQFADAFERYYVDDLEELGVEELTGVQANPTPSLTKVPSASQREEAI